MGDWSDLNGSSYSPSATNSSRTSAMASINETGGMDSEMVGVVEDSPASFVSRRLGLGELKDEDLQSILNCIHSLDYEESVDGILKDIANGMKAVFRLSPGLMILEILRRGTERELFVYWLEGKNMFRQLRHVKKAVLTMAEANRCTRLGATVHDQRWAKKLLKSFPGGKMSFNLSVEL